MHFSTKIGLSGTVAALIVGPLLGAAVFFNARSLLLERIVHEQVNVASGVVAEIDTALTKAAGEISVMAADNFLQDYLESPAEHQEQADTVADELEEQAKLTGPWDGMIVFYPSGRAVFSSSGDQSNGSALADNSLARIAFESALQGKAYHSDRIVSRRTGRPVVIFAVPVFSRIDAEKVVGVIVSRYAWPPIQIILDNVDATATVHLFNSRDEMIGKRSNDHFDEESLQLLRATNPAWKTLPGGDVYAVLDSLHIGGEAELVVVSRPGSEGWSLLLEKPLKVMFAPITVLARNTGLLVFGALLVMGGLFTLLVRHFIRPLGALLEGVRQVEQGRFDQKVTVRSKDEFGELADGFNAMVGKLQETQDELLRKEKLALLGQVAGSVGHELRNPLAVMNNAVYFLQTVLTDADETIREYLSILKIEIDVADRIVADLLDSVRTTPPRPVAECVGELIDRILGKYSVPDTITVTLDISETLPPVWVDDRQIQQVFSNLISNGVEAMPKGGTLAIRAVENRSESTVAVSVCDNGGGIAPEMLAKLFQPLFTTKARGIGLGLVVAKNLTEVNGGTIMVESAVGRGTTCTVELPTSDSSIKEG